MSGAGCANRRQSFVDEGVFEIFVVDSEIEKTVYHKSIVELEKGRNRRAL